MKSKSPYHSALLISLCLQVAFLTFLALCTYHIFPFALIPAVAYWIITPIIIFRHPQPKEFDLVMVRSGYFAYLVLSFPVAWAVSSLLP